MNIANSTIRRFIVLSNFLVGRSSSCIPFAAFISTDEHVENFSFLNFSASWSGVVTHAVRSALNVDRSLTSTSLLIIVVFWTFKRRIVPWQPQLRIILQC